MSVRKDILIAIANAIKGIQNGQQEPMFKTVRRGALPPDPDMPAAVIKKVAWSSQLRSDGTETRDTLRVAVGIMVSNANTDANVASDSLEDATAAVQGVIETDPTLRKMIVRLRPIGGAEDVVAELIPNANDGIEYEIEYDRPTGQP